MGKGQPRAGSDDTAIRDREQLRELTRTAHEAAQDARGAIRELAAARAEFDKATEQRMTEFVNPRLDELAAMLSRKHEQTQAVIDRAAAAINDTVARYLGTGDCDELLGLIADKMAPLMKAAMAEVIGEHISRDLPGIVWNVLTGDNPVSRAIIKSIVTELEHLSQEPGSAARTFAVRDNFVTWPELVRRPEAQR